MYINICWLISGFKKRNETATSYVARITFLRDSQGLNNIFKFDQDLENWEASPIS